MSALATRFKSSLAGLLLVVGAAVSMAQAAEPMLNFDTPAEEALYRQLVQEYRCLKCQNQNLADSKAELAGDLRRQVYQQVVAGQSKGEIDSYLTSRYGDFVLYRPPFRASTVLLWLGPFALLALALVYGYRFIRQPPRAAGSVAPGVVIEARKVLQDSNSR